MASYPTYQTNALADTILVNSRWGVGDYLGSVQAGSSLPRYCWTMNDIGRVSTPRSREFVRWIYELDPDAARRLVASELDSWAFQMNYKINDDDLHFIVEESLQKVTVTVSWWGRPAIRLVGGQEDRSLVVDPGVIKSGVVVIPERVSNLEIYSTESADIAPAAVTDTDRIYRLVGWDPGTRRWIFAADPR